MSRRPLVIAILALLAALVLAPILLLALAGTAGEPTAGDDPAGGPEPAAVLVPDHVGWVFATPLWEERDLGARYALQAGTLGEAGPVVDIQVPWGADLDAHPGRSPAVGPVVRGTVVYVADDGTTSSVRRVEVDSNGGDEQLAVVDEVVWAMAVSPDGTSAYLALVDRADPERDLGIVRLSLDGLGGMERIVDPAPAAILPAAPNRLAAILTFDLDLQISPDGRHLLRRGCEGMAGCQQEAIDLETGNRTSLGDRHVFGVAGGIALVQDCGPADCRMELIDLVSGASRWLPGPAFEGMMAMADGRALVAYVDGANGRILRALDPRDGSVIDILRAPRGGSIGLMPIPGDVRLSLPDGYLLAGVTGDEAVGAVLETHILAVPLDGREPVELPDPPFRPEFGGVQG